MAGGTVRGNRQVERFLDYCRTATVNGQAISGDTDSGELLADIILEDDTGRLFGLRNFWMSHSRRPMSYEGSQSSYWGKMSGLRKARLMQQALGYFAVVNDRQWAPAQGWTESYMKTSIVAVHPAGTQDIQRVIMARRMGIGRTAKEEAGKIPD